MGIKGLTKLLGDNAPTCIKPQEPRALSGRKIAIDASMCIYQLLVAVRTGTDNLTNDSGVVTSHLNGLFYRTIRLLELGIKPTYVFDGRPPTMKAGELAKRAEAKAAAEEAAKVAREAGDMEAAARHARRVNRVTPEMTADCQKLLRLMGIPVVCAPCEAESQCAELAKAGLVYGTASEDMDSLTFGTPVMIRHLWAGTASTAVKKGIKPTEFVLADALSELDLSMDEFIDLCILCGCDYVDGIKGVGVVKALSLVRKHKDLAKIVDSLKSEKKYIIPEEYPVNAVRDMFLKPEITPASEISLKWGKPDLEGLRKFMVEDNQFDPVKMDNGIKRLLASKKVTNQVRVDSFFSKKPAISKDKKNDVASSKGTAKTTPSKTGKGKRVAAPLKGKSAKRQKS